VPASGSGPALSLLPDGGSCTTSAGCLVALSAGPPQSPFGVPLAYATWNGVAFSAPVPLGGDGALEAVACLTGGWCITVGQTARDPQHYQNQHLQVISEVTTAG
jgi:acyl dehydratase